MFKQWFVTGFGFSLGASLAFFAIWHSTAVIAAKGTMFFMRREQAKLAAKRPQPVGGFGTQAQNQAQSEQLPQVVKRDPFN